MLSKLNPALHIKQNNTFWPTEVYTGNTSLV